MELIESSFIQTDIGCFPSDWQVKSLGEIGSFSKGRGIRKDEVISEGLPCVRYGQLYTEHHEYIKSINSFISKSVAAESTPIRKGDILFAGSGETKEEIGKCAAFIDDNEEAYAGGDVIVFSPKGQNSLFLGFLLNHEVIVKQKARLGQGDAVVHIYPRSLSEIKVPIPPIAEQAAIANTLMVADRAVTSLEKLIAKKCLIKQGAMQELLKPKKGWRKRQLGTCLLRKPDYGINAAATGYSDSLPAYLRITDISENGRYISENKVSIDDNRSDGYFLREGDVVFARTGASVGKSYAYDPSDGQLVFAGFLIRLTPNPKVLRSGYLKFYTQTSSYWSWVQSNSTRSGQQGLNSTDFQTLELFFPDVAEQNSIVRILESIDKEIAALEALLLKRRRLKQGMTHTLLTGRIRLI